MSALPRQSSLISPEEYLAGELTSEIKHEYLGGIVHAMAGARNVHNVIAGNIFAALHSRLRGQKCQPFNSDTKLRIFMPSGQLRYYYPDAQVVCDQNPLEDSFQDRPVVIFEVLSLSTKRTDEKEKLQAYTTLPTLDTYVLVDSNSWRVTMHQRSSTIFERTIMENQADVIRLPCLNLELPIAELYENAVLLPPSEEEILEYGDWRDV